MRTVTSSQIGCEFEFDVCIVRHPHTSMRAVIMTADFLMASSATLIHTAMVPHLVLSL